MKDRLIEFGYAAGMRLVRGVPRAVSWPVAAAVADRAARRPGRGTQRLADNLRRVVGPERSDAEHAELVRQATRSYARYWLEAFRLPGLTREQILAGFHLDGRAALEADIAAGHGAVVALPHAGNWDAAGAWVAASGWPITTVAERLRPEGVYERFLAFRRSLGMEILPLTGGDRAPLDVLAERLAAGTIVPLLADRDLSARGVEVTFFGGRTRMPAGPALLAIRTGAPLYTADMWFDADTARARLRGPLALPDPASGSLDVRVRELTQRVADSLALGIAAHPQDWHMLQRLWLDDRAPGRVHTADRADAGGAAAGPSSAARG